MVNMCIYVCIYCLIDDASYGVVTYAMIVVPKSLICVSSPNVEIHARRNPARRVEIKEVKKVVRPIHQLPRLAAPRTYFLASSARHVGGGVALCWFYEALKNGPRARSSPSFSLSSSPPFHSYPGLPSLTVSSVLPPVSSSTPSDFL